MFKLLTCLVFSFITICANANLLNINDKEGQLTVTKSNGQKINTMRCKLYVDGDELIGQFVGIEISPNEPAIVNNVIRRVEFALEGARRITDNVYQVEISLMRSDDSMCTSQAWVHNVKSKLAINQNSVEINYSYRCNRKQIERSYRCDY